MENKQQPPTIENLLDFLAKYKGKIVSTASLEPEWIDQARASGRLYVDQYSYGFVWEPDFKNFPETIEEVELFEKWYPLAMELPESESAKMFERIIAKFKLPKNE